MQRVKLVAQAVSANKFSEKALDNTIDQFKKILRFPESVRHIPKMLAEAGIRLVIVEPLARTRIDGVCVWLDKQSPVIGLSLRIDRVDSLWFTLFHEMWHVKNRDGLMTPAIVDSSLTGDGAVSSNDKPETERKADAFAAEALIAPKEMDNFLARVAPLFSRQRIEGFAARLGINPAIVIGQLHHRGEIEWNQHSRDFNVKIRDVMTQTALSDGWGQVLPAVS